MSYKLIDSNDYYERLGNYYIDANIHIMERTASDKLFFTLFHKWIFREHGAKVVFNYDTGNELWFESKDRMIEFILRWSN